MVSKKIFELKQQVDIESVAYSASAFCTLDKLIEAQTFINEVCRKCFVEVFGDHIGSLMIDEIMIMHNLNHYFKYDFTFSSTSSFEIPYSSSVNDNHGSQAAYTAFDKHHSQRLSSYHTMFHCVDLARRVFEYKNIIDGFDMSKETLVELLVAALFHDVRHTQGERNLDIINIGLAVDELYIRFRKNILVKISDVSDHSLDNVILKSLNVASFTDMINNAAWLISKTEFPYSPIVSDLENIVDDELSMAAYLLRFCDVLQSNEVDVCESQRGLKRELSKTNSNIANESAVDFLKQSAEFVRSFTKIATNSNQKHMDIFGKHFNDLLERSANRILKLQQYTKGTR